jgi:hypothetical protein
VASSHVPSAPTSFPRFAWGEIETTKYAVVSIRRKWI